MSVREYIGARYVPVFANPIDWNSANTYEPLTIVLHEGNSYTSRQAVPAGVQITNTAYWAQTGNYNAQIEQYRQDVTTLANKFPVSVLDGGTGGTDAATARTNLDAAQADGATNTLYDAEQAITANAAAIASINAVHTLTGANVGTLKPNRSWRAVNANYVIKRNGIVQGSIGVNIGESHNAGDNVYLLTLPTDFRPITAITVPYDIEGTITIFESGEILFKPNNNMTAWVWARFVFMAS